MIKLSFRIYLLANLTVVLSFLIMGLPLKGEEFSFLLLIGLISLVITLPVIPALFLVFWVVAMLRQNIFIKWILFLVLIAFCSFIPLFILERGMHGDLLQFSMPAAFLGVLFQANPIHQYLINSYGKENPETV